MYQVYAHKATILQDCFLGENENLISAQMIADVNFQMLKKLMASSHCRPFVCVYIKQDNKIISQYGSK